MYMCIVFLRGQISRYQGGGPPRLGLFAEVRSAPIDRGEIAGPHECGHYKPAVNDPGSMGHREVFGLPLVGKRNPEQTGNDRRRLAARTCGGAESSK